MSITTPYEKVQKSALAIQAEVSTRSGGKPPTPQIGLILGSGLGHVADQIKNPVALAYADIPYFQSPSIQGHVGKMVFGEINGISVVCLMGRFHFYEGHPLSDVILPTRVLWALGVHTLILTNAAGGVNTRFRPGDLMLIQDHLNLMGTNPLMGPHSSEFGARFPDMTRAYDPGCFEILKNAAEKVNVPVQAGVYAGLSGPSYETPSEIRMLRTLGADAAGMSTVPECIAANQLGIRVAGISCITNLGAGMLHDRLTHQEVLEHSKLSAGNIMKLIGEAIPYLGVKPAR